MAKVSAHGTEVGTVHFTTFSKRYMSDGVILKNQGAGWKIFGKVKSDRTPQQAYESQLTKQNELLATRPALAAYRKALHDVTGMCNRARLHWTIGTMPDDADGVWSEACDGYGDNVHAGIDEIVKLCQLFKLATLEASTTGNQCEA